MSNVALHLARQQHPCQHISLLAIRHGGHVHSRQRQTGIRLCLQIQLHLSTWHHVIRRCRHFHPIRDIHFRTDEEQTFSQHMPLRIKQCQLVHPGRQHLSCPFQHRHGTACQRVTIHNATIVHQRIAQQSVLHCHRSRKRCRHIRVIQHVHSHHHPFRQSLRQLKLQLLPVSRGQLQILRFIIRRKAEIATSILVGHCSLHQFLVLVQNHALHIEHTSLVIIHRKCNTRCQILHQITALWIEVYMYLSMRQSIHCQLVLILLLIILR